MKLLLNYCIFFLLTLFSCAKSSTSTPAAIEPTGTNDFTISQSKDILCGYWQSTLANIVYYDANNVVLTNQTKTYPNSYWLMNWGDTQGVLIYLTDRSSYDFYGNYPNVILQIVNGVTLMNKITITSGTPIGWTITALSSQSMTLASIGDPNKTYTLNGQTYNTASKSISTITWTKYTP